MGEQRVRVGICGGGGVGVSYGCGDGYGYVGFGFGFGFGLEGGVVWWEGKKGKEDGKGKAYMTIALGISINIIVTHFVLSLSACLLSLFCSM